jgi:hypothetical protein
MSIGPPIADETVVSGIRVWLVPFNLGFFVSVAEESVLGSSQHLVSRFDYLRVRFEAGAPS